MPGICRMSRMKRVTATYKGRLLQRIKGQLQQPAVAVSRFSRGPASGRMVLQCSQTRRSHMARIELRYCTVVLRDSLGLPGVDGVTLPTATATAAPVQGESTMTMQNVNLPRAAAPTKIPVGARFTLASEAVGAQVRPSTLSPAAPRARTPARTPSSRSRWPPGRLCHGRDLYLVLLRLYDRTHRLWRCHDGHARGPGGGGHELLVLGLGRNRCAAVRGSWSSRASRATRPRPS